MSGGAWLLLAVLAAVFAAPFVLERLRPGPPRKPAAIRAAGGKLADLPSGQTFYRWIGPARGPVAVLIHGISTPHQVWEEVAAGLAETSFRVLVYDLYGRGLSDAPTGRQDAAFFVRQLEELLDHEGLAHDLTLVGYSMGGAIATAFADARPDRMERLVLVAASGIERREGALDAFMRQVPVLGDWLHGILGPRRARAGASGAGAVAEAKRAQAGQRGHAPSLLASRRGILSRTLKDAHRRIGTEDVPVLAVWGTADTIVPIAALGTLAQWNRNARQETIEGAGHDLLQTHPDAIAVALRRLLRED